MNVPSASSDADEDLGDDDERSDIARGDGV